MRRSMVLLFAAASLAFIGCDDGPNQTFSPAPDGAGQKWNDGKTPGGADPATGNFQPTGGGTNKQDICDAPTKKAAWAFAFNQPIIPPTTAGNINMAGGDSWAGITIEQAEAAPKYVQVNGANVNQGGNCQSINDGDLYGDGDLTNQWGDNGEITFEYHVTNRKIVHMALNPGYTGNLHVESRPNGPFETDGKHHTYDLSVTNTFTKDGKPWAVSWTGFPGANGTGQPATGKDGWANELGDALLATFLPGIPPQPDCVDSGTCILNHFGDLPYFGVSAIGLYITNYSLSAGQPTPSTIANFDLYFQKVMPFSGGASQLKLDAVGPTGTAFGLGPNKDKNCTLQFGLKYADFLGNCVQVNGGNDDVVQKNKLLGGMDHDTESYQFDLQGLRVNFLDSHLADGTIVKDNDRPADDDTVMYLSNDQADLGPIRNDYTGSDPTKPKDLHGTGLLYAEFVRTVQDNINSLLMAQGVPAASLHEIGDDACISGLAANCTGFEGFVIPIDPNKMTADPSDKTVLGNPVGPILKSRAADPAKFTVDGDPTNDQAHLSLLPGLVLGAQKIAICGASVGGGPTTCVADRTFTFSLGQATNVLGGGSTAGLPAEMQDGRFYFKAWAQAFFKMLMTEGQKPDGSSTYADIHAQAVDPNNIFFDSQGSGQFEISEYVDRRHAAAGTPPVDVVVTADVKNGIFDRYEFTRKLYRGESALYAAMTPPGTPAGSKDVLLSNVFGAPALAGLWSSYECAAGLKSCPSDPPPYIDETGRRLLADYPGPFSQGTVFQLGIGAPSAVNVTETHADIQQALVSVPLQKNPYDSSTATGDVFTALVPWTPKQPGVGFPIALNGTQDKFVSSYDLDLTGTTITADIKYDVLTDASGKPQGIQLEAVHSTDFLGQVFLCSAQNPDGSVSLLHAAMYTPVSSLLNWINTHQGAAAQCGLIVRYSPYNNYPDFITATGTGVRLEVTQGGGLGRIVGAILFAPGQ